MEYPIELIYLFVGVATALSIASMALPNPNMKNGRSIPLLMFVASALWIYFFATTTDVIMGYDTDGEITIVTVDTPVSIFSDTYTTNAGWTQVSTGVDVDSTSADKVAFALSGVNAERRVHKSLGATLGQNEEFTANFDYTFVSSSSPDDIIFSLSAGSSEIRLSNQDFIGVAYRLSTNTGFNIAYKNDAGSLTHCQIPSPANSATTYYVTFKRLTSTSAELSVYSDSARTTLISGYPHTCAIPSGIGGFTHIQHGNHVNGVHSLSAQLDNMDITGVDTETTTTTSGEATPILFAFTPYLQMAFMMLGAMMMLVGALSQKYG